MPTVTRLSALHFVKEYILSTLDSSADSLDDTTVATCLNVLSRLLLPSDSSSFHAIQQKYMFTARFCSDDIAVDTLAKFAFSMPADVAPEKFIKEEPQEASSLPLQVDWLVRPLFCINKEEQTQLAPLAKSILRYLKDIYSRGLQ